MPLEQQVHHVYWTEINCFRSSGLLCHSGWFGSAGKRDYNKCEACVNKVPGLCLCCTVAEASAPSHIFLMLCLLSKYHFTESTVLTEATQQPATALAPHTVSTHMNKCKCLWLVDNNCIEFPWLAFHRSKCKRSTCKWGKRCWINHWLFVTHIITAQAVSQQQTHLRKPGLWLCFDHTHQHTQNMVHQASSDLWKLHSKLSGKIFYGCV